MTGPDSTRLASSRRRDGSADLEVEHGEGRRAQCSESVAVARAERVAEKHAGGGAEAETRLASSRNRVSI